LELDIPLVNTLKELGKQPTIDDLDCPFDIDDIKLYIELKWLEKEGDSLGECMSCYDVESGMLLALCVAEWMQDGSLVHSVFENLSYMTLMFCVPVEGTTESVRYKWYEKMIDGLDDYVNSRHYWGWNQQRVRKELDRSNKIETLEHIEKYAKKFKDNIKALVAKIEISSSDSSSDSDSNSD